MSYITKKMSDEVPERFFRFQVLLPANVTIPSLDDSAAIKTILLFTLRGVRHTNFFLKVSTKIQVTLCFSLLNN